MAELSDIMLYIAQLKREEREDEKDKALIDLNKLNMELNAKSKILETHLQNSMNKTYELEDEFEMKNLEYQNITGSLIDLKNYNPSATLEVLDNLKSPILDMYVSQINESRSKSSEISNALVDINKTINDAKKVENFYKGEGVTYKGGDEAELYDVEDFTQAKLKLALGLKAGDPIPSSLTNYITKQKGNLDLNIEGLNQALNTAVLEGLKVKKSKLELQDVDKPSYKTKEYIQDLVLSLTTIADPLVISTLESQPMSDIVHTSALLSGAQINNDQDQADLLKGQLDTQKITLGASITGTEIIGSPPLPKDNKENMAIGSIVLTGFTSYYNTAKEGEQRNIVNWINSLEEIYRYADHRLRGVDQLKAEMMKATKGTSEYKELEDRLKGLQESVGVFGETVFKLTGWNLDGFMEQMPQILLYGDDLQHQTTLLARQQFEEKQGRELKSTLSKTQKQMIKTKKERTLASPHKIDYSQLIFGDDLVEGPFGIDTDGDGVNDAIDMNQDNKPDTIQELTGPAPVVKTSTATQFISGTNWTEETLKEAYKLHQSGLAPNQQGMSYKSFKDMALEYDSPSTYGLTVKDYNPSKNEHIANNDYIYNSETHELKDITTGDVERVVTDGKEKLYWSVTGKSHDGYSKKGQLVKNANVDEAVETEISKLENAASNIVGSKIPLLSAIQQDDGTYVAEVDGDKLNNVFDTIDIIYEDSKQNFGTVFEEISNDVHLAPESHVEGTGINVPIYHDQPHYTMSRALGGGHFAHDNSPFYTVYYDVLRVLWNQTIDQDDDTWFKLWHKESEFGEVMGAMIKGGQDWQYPGLFEKHYPEMWDRIDEQAFKIADKYHKEWLLNTINGKATKGYEIDLGQGYKLELGDEDFNRKDEYDIMRVISRLYNIEY